MMALLYQTLKDLWPSTAPTNKYTTAGGEYVALDSFLATRNIAHIYTPINSSESIGSAEVAVRDAKRLLATAIAEFGALEENWSLLVAAVSTANNLICHGNVVPPTFYASPNPTSCYHMLPNDNVSLREKGPPTAFRGMPVRFVGYLGNSLCDLLVTNVEEDTLTIIERHLRSVRPLPNSQSPILGSLLHRLVRALLLKSRRDCFKSAWKKR